MLTCDDLGGQAPALAPRLRDMGVQRRCDGAEHGRANKSRQIALQHNANRISNTRHGQDTHLS